MRIERGPIAPETIDEYEGQLEYCLLDLNPNDLKNDWQRGFRSGLMRALGILTDRDTSDVEDHIRALHYQAEARLKGGAA